MSDQPGQAHLFCRKLDLIIDVYFLYFKPVFATGKISV